MRRLFCCVVLLGTSLVAIAAEPRPDSSPVERAVHLLAAASHLEAIGQNDAAKALRDQVRLIKLNEIESDIAGKLSADYLHKRNWPESDRKLTIRVRAYRLDIDKFAQGEADIDRGLPMPQCDYGDAPQNRLRYYLIEAEHAWLAEIETWRSDGRVQLLSSSDLATTTGNVAAFHVGGALPFPKVSLSGNRLGEYRRIGTTIDFVPHLMKKAEDKIHMELAFNYSVPDDEHAITLNGATVPALDTRACDIGYDTDPTKVMVIRQGISLRSGSRPARFAGRRMTPLVGDSRPGEFVLICHTDIEPAAAAK